MEQLSSDVAGMAGLEPTISESKSGVLPLHYIPLLLRFKRQVGGERGRQCRPRSLLMWGGIWGSNPRHPEPQSGALPTELIPPSGTPRGIRTPDLLLRRQLLYPAELLARIDAPAPDRDGAGDGNRTHVSSLEGWCSTIELHPQETLPHSALG